jgi:hypothetical protein
MAGAHLQRILQALPAVHARVVPQRRPHGAGMRRSCGHLRRVRTVGSARFWQLPWWPLAAAVWRHAAELAAAALEVTPVRPAPGAGVYIATDGLIATSVNKWRIFGVFVGGFWRVF